MLEAYVPSVLGVLDVCFKCFIWIFQKLVWHCICCNDYTHMFQMHVSSVPIFRRMLQMFHLDVSKVDLVLRAAVRLLLLVCRRGSHAST
jgi:hypothetical protein